MESVYIVLIIVVGIVIVVFLVRHHLTTKNLHSPATGLNHNYSYTLRGKPCAPTVDLLHN